MKSAKPYKRSDRVVREILHILGQIQTQYIDLSHLGLITFTKVLLTPDLKLAKIMFSLVNRKKEAKVVEKELNHLKKAFRKYLGQELRIKFTPELKFYYDNTMDYTQKIDEIFSTIKLTGTDEKKTDSESEMEHSG
ncbi:MAG: 30S ribosome-binding factor RbfA [Candidatus Neomarinimicrobiota bacterium]